LAWQFSKAQVFIWKFKMDISQKFAIKINPFCFLPAKLEKANMYFTLRTPVDEYRQRVVSTESSKQKHSFLVARIASLSPDHPNGRIHGKKNPGSGIIL
jgi:hypothetical protein